MNQQLIGLIESLKVKKEWREEIEQLKRKKEEIKIFVEKLKQELNQLGDLREEEVENKFKLIKQNYDDLYNETHNLKLKESALVAAKQEIEKEILHLSKEIESKEKIKSQLKQLNELKGLIENKFVKIVSLIENQVMLNLNQELNARFIEWFKLLVNNETLQVRINFNFTPIIEQAGYELSYDYLSGGERTAIALSYRLALNEVINSMLSKLNTRDLLILDEPTDGFSRKQIESFKAIFNQLKVKQLIIVSHESLIEDMVAHVIKFRKENNRTIVEPIS